MRPLERTQGFSIIFSSDLLVDLIQSSFELNCDFVKDIILIKFEVQKAKKSGLQSVHKVFL